MRAIDNVQTVRHAALMALRAQESPSVFDWTPSPDEIAAGCLRVQATWDDVERERRDQYAIDPDMASHLTCTRAI